MAPKRKGKEANTNSDEAPAVTTRVTRSTAAKLNKPDSALPPPPKKASKKQKTKAEVEEKSPAEGKVEKLSSQESVVEEEGAGKQAKEEDEDTAAKNDRTLVIEHCKQCNSFKTRAVQVKNGVESGVPGITVLVNPEKPRRGCFEIREEGGETFISLLDMKRPFTPMKQLDMDKVISDIIEKIK